jgi:hypothetical protein
VSVASGWELSGTYLESCNCEAICPCRRIGGRAGGRSTYGTCLGALSWTITSGQVGDVDLGGLNAVLALHYEDDEPGSPWDFHLYVDERGGAEQRQALEDVLLGRLGGTPERQFPWVFKPSNLLGVHAVAIEIDHTPGRGWFRVRDRVTVRVREPVPDQEPVTCVIPGHDREGRELIADELRVDAAPLAFEFSERCAYESTFAYSSDDA